MESIICFPFLAPLIIGLWGLIGALLYSIYLILWED